MYSEHRLCTDTGALDSQLPGAATSRLSARSPQHSPAAFAAPPGAPGHIMHDSVDGHGGLVNTFLYPYEELWQGADLLVRKGLVSEGEGSSRWLFFSALLMLSFCLEAYLNFAGPLVFGASWSQGPQALVQRSVKDRLRLIATACGVELQGQHKYWTVAGTLLDLRESLTQPRQRRAGLVSLLPEGKSAQLPPTWAAHCQPSVVRDYQYELRLMLERVHAGLPARPAGQLFGR